ncbi:protein PELPK1-like [Schistocerca americana]|nr:protein PELPK1-like [Schistocerca americana]
MEPSVPAFSGPLIHDFPQSLSPGSIIPRIPGPPPSPQKSPSTLSAPTTPRYGEPYSPLTPKFPEAPVIPKIPGPPPSPKVSRPSTPKAKEPPSPKFSEASIIPKIPGPPVSPKHSRPTTPKQNEGILVDTSKPSVLQLSQSHSRPASPLLNELSTKEITKSPKLRDPPASPRSPQRSVKKPPDESVPIDEELNIAIPPTVAEHPQPPNQLSVVCDIYESPKSSPVRKPSVKRPLQRCLTLPTKERDDSESLLATMPEKIVEDPGKIPESESFDQEENRDTVADGCLPTRPTLFDLRPRPKLKTQWSMDDSRSNRVPAGVPSMKPAEKRRRFFMRKQTNSAPDSFEGPGHLSIKPKEHHSVSFCLGSVRKCRGSDSSIQPPTLPTISKYAFSLYTILILRLSRLYLLHVPFLKI